MPENRISKFFNKKRQDKHFKRTGPGHVLGNQSTVTSSASAPQQGQSSGHHGPHRQQPAHSQAAEAALARLNALEDSKISDQEKYRAKIRLEAKRRLEQENPSPGPQESGLDVAEPGRVNRDNTDADDEWTLNPYVRFRCDIIGMTEPSTLADIRLGIQNFLLDQSLDDDMKCVAAALTVRSLNDSDEKVSSCIDVLCKYIDNIVNNENEAKFRRIRANNKAFVERVSKCYGHDLVMSSIGFELTTVENEEFWVIPDHVTIDIDRLITVREVLTTSERIEPQLARCPMVIGATRVANTADPGDDFFNLTVGELKQMQRAKTDALALEETLRTQAMRERDRPLRSVPRYMIFRFRLPDSTVLQGTFASAEPISALFQFISDECLIDELASASFTLSTNIGGKVVTLNDLESSQSLTSLNFGKYTIVQLTFVDSVHVSSVLSAAGPCVKPQLLSN